jgi:hypothetical protein
VTRFLSSTKLAVALCLLLAAGGVAGSLLYQGNTAFGKSPAFNVFRSPFFLVPACLLAVNVLFCAGSRLRKMPAGEPRTWTFAGLHLGLLLLAAGLALDGLSGFAGTQYFPVGVPYSGYHNWRTGRDETFPFSVEVLDAEVRHHPRNLQIGVMDASGNRVGLFTAREGTSFSVGKEGILLTPRKFDADGKALHLDASAGGRTVTGLVATPDAPASVSGYAIVPVAFADPEPSDYVVRVRFSLPGSPPEEQILRINHPGSFGGISFCIVRLDTDRFGNGIVGLQMTREPGGPLFWVGAFLFGVSLLGHLMAKGAFRRGPDPGPEAAPAGPANRVASAGGVAALLLLSALPSGAHAFGAVIGHDTTWSGEVRVTEPVSVEKGATLRILPGTTVLLSGEDRDRDACEDGYIQVFGELLVEGEPGRPVRFGRLQPEKAWREIFLKDARASIRGAVFEGAVWGLHVHDGDVRIEDSVIRGNEGGARMKGVGVAIRGCEIRGNGIGLRFWDGGPSVSASVIEENGVGLFYRDGTGGGKINGNRIRNRDWDVKVGDWATGDLDLSGNFWGPATGPSREPRVRDYRERRDSGTIVFDRPVPAAPAGEGPGSAR